MSQTVLLIEDDPSLARIVATALQDRGHPVSVATNGRRGLELADSDEPDVVILDLGLPDLDGLEVCRRLRTHCASPIIVLSADSAEDRKIRALDEGADDYVTKPFSMPELMARLRVALRHRSVQPRPDVPVVVGDLGLDPGAREVVVGDAPIVLTRKEFDLLAALASNPGRVLTHGALLRAGWGPGGGTTESLRVHVASLRRKLGRGERRPTIESEPGVGYRLCRPPPPEERTT
jgi:two-component system KDP operon response regulator KdpE